MSQYSFDVDHCDRQLTIARQRLSLADTTCLILHPLPLTKSLSRKFRSAIRKQPDVFPEAKLPRTSNNARGTHCGALVQPVTCLRVKSSIYREVISFGLLYLIAELVILFLIQFTVYYHFVFRNRSFHWRTSKCSEQRKHGATLSFFKAVVFNE